jgi:hypothetical protein
MITRFPSLYTLLTGSDLINSTRLQARSASGTNGCKKAREELKRQTHERLAKELGR